MKEFTNNQKTTPLNFKNYHVTIDDILLDLEIMFRDYYNGDITKNNNSIYIKFSNNQVIELKANIC